MRDLFTDKLLSNNLSCSKVTKKKVIITLYLKIVRNNDTMKLTLFSTVESNILTNKNVIQMVKKRMKRNELRSLNFHKV